MKVPELVTVPVEKVPVLETMIDPLLVTGPPLKAPPPTDPTVIVPEGLTNVPPVGAVKLAPAKTFGGRHHC